MIRSFAGAEAAAAKIGPKRISVMRAENREFLLALKEAYSRGYGEPILIGSEPEIRRIADEIEFDIGCFQLINEKDSQEIAYKAVQLVSSGDAQLVLRGHIDGYFMFRSLIRSASMSGIKRRISVVALFQLPLLPRFVGMTDPGVTMAPDFQEKIEIIQNAVDIFSHLGYDTPRIGILTAGRGLNTNLDSVTDAIKIRDTLSRGELTGCTIEDGLCLSDFFLGKDGFLESHEVIDLSLIPDILLVHNLEIANMFSKIDTLPLNYFSGWARHGILMSGGIPVTIPSRSDRHDTIITAIALGVCIA